MSAKSDEDEYATPLADVKMASNAHNFALIKNPKKEKEWHQALSAGFINLWHHICPIVTVKSLDSSINHKIQGELDLHADTSVVGPNVLLVHDHEHYAAIFGYSSKSRHKNVTTVDAAVAYDNPQTEDTSVLLPSHHDPLHEKYLTMPYAVLS